jgi:hypothetical protein
MKRAEELKNALANSNGPSPKGSGGAGGGSATKSRENGQDKGDIPFGSFGLSLIESVR